MLTRIHRDLPALALTLGMTGCAVGPNFHPPAPPATTGYATAPVPAVTASAAIAGGEAQQFDSGADVSFAWWEAFGSPQLNALVTEALRANPTVPAAQAALRQAQEAQGEAQHEAIIEALGKLSPASRAAIAHRAEENADESRR